MRSHEKEAFLKAFFLFYISLMLLTVMISLFYYQEQKHHLEDYILDEMKEYNFNFENEAFSMDIVNNDGNAEIVKLYISKQEVYSYYYVPTTKRAKLLKIIYPYEKYIENINDLKIKVALLLFGVNIVLILISAVFAFYTLKPLKNAYDILEEFLKDIIHDLNTPITAIQLNTKLLKRKIQHEALDRIELSTKTIHSLYKNLEVFIHKLPANKEEIDLNLFLEERVYYFQKLYPDINFILEKTDKKLYLQKDSFLRIIDNLFSNACKYNKKNGKIKIKFNQNTLTIEDSGVGIKNPSKIFRRLYKESERGLGLGLNIVKKLCEEINIKIAVESQAGVGTKISLKLPAEFVKSYSKLNI